MAIYDGLQVTPQAVTLLQPEASGLSALPPSATTTYYYRTTGGTRGSVTSAASIPAGAVVERVVTA